MIPRQFFVSTAKTPVGPYYHVVKIPRNRRHIIDHRVFVGKSRKHVGNHALADRALSPLPSLPLIMIYSTGLISTQEESA